MIRDKLNCFFVKVFVNNPKIVLVELGTVFNVNCKHDFNFTEHLEHLNGEHVEIFFQKQ